MLVHLIIHLFVDAELEKCNACVPARDLGVYVCFASRPRATLASCCPRARARRCALLRSGMPRVCVRDWIICANVEFKIAVVVFVQVLLLLGGVRLHGKDC